MRIILRSRDRRGSVELRLLFVFHCYIFAFKRCKTRRNKPDLAVPGSLEKIVYGNN